VCKPSVKKYETEPFVPPPPPAPPDESAELKISTKGKTSTQQNKKRKGKSKLRTDLAIQSGTSNKTGLNIPT